MAELNFALAQAGSTATLVPAQAWQVVVVLQAELSMHVPYATICRSAAGGWINACSCK